MKSNTKIAGSLRNLFIVIITVAMTTIVINNQSVLYSEMNGSNVITFERGEIMRQLTEGGDFRGFGRSLSQHQDAFSRDMTDQDIKQKLHRKLTQIETRLQQNVFSPTIAFGGSQDDRNNLSSVTLKGQRLHIVNADEDLEQLGLENWSVMLCSNLSSCPTQSVKLEQKVDVIPGLLKFVNDPTALCSIARYLHEEPCCITNTRAKLEGTSGHGLKSSSILVNNTKCSYQHDGIHVHWHLPHNPVMYEAGPLLRLHSLVTSVLPLRLYLSSHIYSGPYQAFDDNLKFKKSSVGETLQHISEVYGLDVSSHWWDTIQAMVLTYFHQMEAALEGSISRCRRCFQFLNVDVICHSITQCIVVKISPRTRLTTEYITTIWPIIASRYHVTDDVAESLNSVLSYLPIDLCEDEGNNEGCILDKDLIYILDDRREMLNMSDWIKIYPSVDSHVTNPSLNALSSTNTQWRNSYQLHDVLVELQKYYSTSRDQEFLDRNQFSTEWDGQTWGNSVGGHIRTKECSNYKKDYGKVGDIRTSPAILIEELSPGEYYANVSYDTISIKLWAGSMHCQCDLRIESKYNGPGPRNITLGLEATKVRIYTVDISVRELTIVGVTMVTFYRKPRGLQVTNNVVSDLFKTCGFKQDCSLPFLKEDRCGLYNLDMKWTSYTSLSWQWCKEGDNPGEWAVPCISCNDAASCDWRRSKWQPYGCSYGTTDTASLKQCFKGRKLLFIGDSTNRGVLNYMLEKINGSLWDWDKTHSIKVYNKVNETDTSFSFAYYPHFWLPLDHRPTFYKIIYQLIKSSLPIENNRNTVLVVGGVQWLAKQHIDYIIEALQKKGLSNITKVVKGIGAGFHQPVEGVRFVTPTEQVKLTGEEADVMSYAKTKGFKVVSTFNMTMARYKDFMEGKCACHFHKVKSLDGPSKSTGSRQYTVEGEINAAYSDIVIDQICS